MAVLLLVGWLGTLGAVAQSDPNLQNVPKQKPFQLHGSLAAGLTYYHAEGINGRRQPFSWYLSGAPVLTIYGVVMPFSLVVSEQESRFSQPFNQYGVSPYYKWVKLHLGYRNVRFSNYTLGGANFLGAGVELTPGKWRLGYVYGQFNRAVSEDSLTLSGRRQYVRPTYRRVGFGAKLGFGSGRNYADLLLFKATDEINSIATPSRRSLVLPQENVAVGLRSQFGLFNQRLTFDLDLGASLLTRNLLLGPASPRLGLPDRQQLIWLNESSAFFTAGQLSASYQSKHGSLGLIYQRIDPDYQSLGAYFFQNDVEQLTLNPALNLLGGRLSLSGSWGVSRDNLSGLRSRTTRRSVSALTIGYVPTPTLQLNLSYSNFGTGQGRGVGDVFNGSLAVSVVNASYGGSVAWRLGNKQLRHVLMLAGTVQQTDDQNQFTRQYAAASSRFGTLTYTMAWPAKRLTISAVGSYVALATYGRNTQNTGGSLNLSRQWLKGQIRATVNQTMQTHTLDGQPDGLFSSTGLSLALRPGPTSRQTLTLNTNYLYNRYQAGADGSTFRNFTELRGNVLYGISF